MGIDNHLIYIISYLLQSPFPIMFFLQECFLVNSKNLSWDIKEKTFNLIFGKKMKKCHDVSLYVARYFGSREIASLTAKRIQENL